MIHFSCRCGRALELDDDQAGSDVQCPACGVLVTVPALSDAGGMDADGTYKVDAAETEHERARLDELHRVFTRNRVDERTGQEIDLRATYEDLADAGVLDGPQPEASPVYAKPRYDPVTGELIRPIEVKDDAEDPPVDPASIPMARANVGYGTGRRRQPQGAGPVPVLLFAPVNLVVMGVVFAAHFLGQFIAFGVAALGPIFAVLFAPLGLGLLVAIMAHYVNTIDETGPRDLDELPRPGRDLSISDDILMPFGQLLLALLLSYGPALLMLVTGRNLPAPVVVMLSLLLAAAGTFYFPACLLTAATGGVANNLRPDRVLSVVWVTGPKYLLFVLLWLFTSVVYAVAIVATTLMPAALFVPMPRWVQPYVAYPLLIAAIYLAHLFAWELGTAYRAHHERFAWVLQRHRRREHEPAFGFQVQHPAATPAAAAPPPLAQREPVQSQPPLAKRAPHGR